MFVGAAHAAQILARKTCKTTVYTSVTSGQEKMLAAAFSLLHKATVNLILTVL
jgi:hypothetical protein